ncbi:MAG TPA: hypothetical protein VK837_11940 [Longimicrobiales bacterium]|nr:hypothetical protein [Longimicrobiales bacterium]
MSEHDMRGKATPQDEVAAPDLVAPPPALEDEIVAALYAEGLLGGAARTGPTMRDAGTAPPGPARRAWLPLAAAAALALFAGGFAVGQFTGARSTAGAMIAAREADAAATAALVQQAGTAYVQALAQLADRTEREDGGPELHQGGEAAAAAFTAAAAEWARLDPENETAHQVLSLLTDRRESATPQATSQTIWF